MDHPRPVDRQVLDRALAYVDSWLGYRIPTADIPGCALAVAWKGELVYSGGWGWADVEARRPMAADDVFRIASHSKTFTATAVMGLVERGRLQLDDAVVAHVGWLADHRDRRWRDVTVRQLLCHGAGCIRDGLDADYWQMGRPFPDADQLRAEVLAADLVTEPNVALKYSNFGYGVLGAVIEAAGGQPFAQYVEEHITGPLGLSSTVAEPAPPAGAPGAVVTGYGRRGPGGTRRPLPHVDTRALAAATGFASSAPDVCRYLSAHLVGSGQLLSDASKREMQRVHWHAEHPGPDRPEDYGLGVILERVGGRRTFGHSGGFPGHITRSVADPADGLVVSALTNCIDGPASDIAKAVLGIVDAFAGAEGAPSAELLRVEGRYAELWGVLDLVAPGREVLVGRPDTWAPLADADRLEAVDATTLRIADTSSFGSKGELVHVHLDDGGEGDGAPVASLTWAGTSMWPESRWADAERRLLDPPPPGP